MNSLAIRIPSDVTHYTMNILFALSQQTIQACPALIPRAVIDFIFFERGRASTLEILVPEKEARAKVHEFCISKGLCSNTHWAPTTDKIYKCPDCGAFSSDYDSRHGVYCSRCTYEDPDDYSVDEMGRGCRFDEDDCRTKTKYVSTGLMLIRRNRQIPYKKVRNYRKRRNAVYS